MNLEATRLAGMETEYAVFGPTEGGGRLPPSAIAKMLLDRAASDLTHMPGCGHDLFLENGSRFYLDEGCHPELSTPECVNPKDVVRYVLAGDRIVADLCKKVGHNRGDVGAFKSNVDYGDSQATWGCHESYMHRAVPRALHAGLLPHLASRIIYTGAGGFNSLVPGIEFLLSPRVAHLSRAISSSSTHSRGIVHTKDEPLCKGDYHRLHLICGEALCSQTAAWLKVGTTALIVAIFEAGVFDDGAVELEEPLDAMNAFAADPTLKAKARLESGKKVTAIEIQRRCLGQVERHLGASFMPDWASEVCEAWSGVLDGLERDPLLLGATLDWVIKWQLFEQRAEQRGFGRRAVATWSRYMRARATAHQRARRAGVVRGRIPRSDVIPQIWTGSEKLGRFLDLRNELFELDIRFGQLDDKGIFNVLDASGVLDHKVLDDAEVEQARRDPPRGTRARLRGEVIRELAGRPGHTCTWSRILDVGKKRRLEMSNPFETERHWEKIPPTRGIDDIPF